MEDDFNFLNTIANNNLIKSCNAPINISSPFCVSSKYSSPSLSKIETLDSGIDTVTAANDLLENGILVETSKGLVCLSLKDALTSGIAGLNLSVEDLQNVAAQLLIAQNTPTSTTVECQAVSLGGFKVNVLPPDISQVYYKIENDDNRITCTELGEPKSVELQIEISEKPLKPAPKVAKKPTKLKSVVTVPKEITLVSPVVPISQALPNLNTIKTSNQSKKRGGWPKGRKRKPELTEVQAPKAPATGYVLYLNEKRKLYKDLPFPEVTKLLGNLWSNLSLDEKRMYLDRAEIEKKRYREELKAYRQSDAYQSYLNKKRIKRLQGNGTEESDMDATDEIEEEDNEELYCRTCDQWFSTLHNKKEHLYGRQHLQVIAGDFTKERLAAEQGAPALSSYSLSTSLDESSLDGLPAGLMNGACREKIESSSPADMTEAITRLMETSAEREREIDVLVGRLKDVKEENFQLNNQLAQLQELNNKLVQTLTTEKKIEDCIQQKLFTLWSVPSMFCDSSQCELGEIETSSITSITLPDNS